MYCGRHMLLTPVPSLALARHLHCSSKPPLFLRPSRLSLDIADSHPIFVTESRSGKKKNLATSDAHLHPYLLAFITVPSQSILLFSHRSNRAAVSKSAARRSGVVVAAEVAAAPPVSPDFPRTEEAFTAK